jgi:hypothetical protein
MKETTTINSEVVRLELLGSKKRIELIKNLKGPFIVEKISCANCLTLVNFLNPNVLVNVRSISFGLITNIVLEPQCPICGCFIQAEEFFHIVN